MLVKFDQVGGMESKPKNDGGKGKIRMSDEERRELAEKLDQELDEFIGGLETRSSTYEWPEDRWQEVRFIQRIRNSAL
jgi:hypothetical protein